MGNGCQAAGAVKLSTMTWTMTKKGRGMGYAPPTHRAALPMFKFLNAKDKAALWSREITATAAASPRDFFEFPALAELGFYVLVGFLVVGETQVLAVPQ